MLFWFKDLDGEYNMIIMIYKTGTKYCGYNKKNKSFNTDTFIWNNNYGASHIFQNYTPTDKEYTHKGYWLDGIISAKIKKRYNNNNSGVFNEYYLNGKLCKYEKWIKQFKYNGCK